MNDDDTTSSSNGSGSETHSHPIAENIKEYVTTINSLKESLFLSMFVIHAVQREVRKKYDQFVERHCALRREGEEEFVVVPIEHNTGYKVLKSRLEQTNIASGAVPRSFLVALVSEYDTFLGKLLNSLYSIRPELLSSSDRALSFSQLSAFSSLEQARAYVVEKEIETFLRKSHSEQFDWLEKKFELPLRKNLPAWSDFIEVTERRNLFVHAGGIVSSQYVQNCRDHGVAHHSGVHVGTELGVPAEYFRHAHAVLLEIGVKLGQVLWRKLRPAEIEHADIALSDITYDLLEANSFELAKTLLDFAHLTLKKHASERDELVFLVNRAQAYKWSGDSESAVKMLNDIDWSAKSEAFQLAYAVLTDNFGRAADIMEKIGPVGYPHKVYYRDWPLFREFRKSEEFRHAYEKVFGETTFESDKGLNKRPSDDADRESGNDGGEEADGSHNALDS